MFNCLDSFLIFSENESTKKDAILIAVKANVTKDLLKLSN